MNSPVTLKQQHWYTQLNATWLSACLEASRSQPPDVNAFGPLFYELRKMRKDFLELKFTAIPETLVELHIMHSGREAEFLKFPDRHSLEQIFEMITNCEKLGWEEMKSYYEQLKSMALKRVMADFVAKFIKENGPFFPGKDPDTIMVAACSGQVFFDIVIVSLMHHFINNKS